MAAAETAVHILRGKRSFAAEVAAPQAGQEDELPDLSTVSSPTPSENSAVMGDASALARRAVRCICLTPSLCSLRPQARRPSAEGRKLLRPRAAAGGGGAATQGAEAGIAVEGTAPAGGDAAIADGRQRRRVPEQAASDMASDAGGRSDGAARSAPIRAASSPRASSAEPAASAIDASDSSEGSLQRDELHSSELPSHAFDTFQRCVIVGAKPFPHRLCVVTSLLISRSPPESLIRMGLLRAVGWAGQRASLRDVLLRAPGGRMRCNCAAQGLQHHDSHHAAARAAPRPELVVAAAAGSGCCRVASSSSW